MFINGKKCLLFIEAHFETSCPPLVKHIMQILPHLCSKWRLHCYSWLAENIIEVSFFHLVSDVPELKLKINKIACTADFNTALKAALVDEHSNRQLVLKWTHEQFHPLFTIFQDHTWFAALQKKQLLFNFYKTPFFEFLSTISINVSGSFNALNKLSHSLLQCDAKKPRVIKINSAAF